MAVSSSINKIQYTANGTNTVFAFPYSFFAETDLEVYIGDTLQTSGYTVSAVGGSFRNGGNVMFSSAPAASSIVTIVRVLPLTQQTDYEDFSSFPADTFENDLDRAIMIAAQLEEKISRQMVAPVSDPVVDLTLPSKTARASTHLAFDADGKPIASGGIPSVPATAWAATLLDDADAAAGRGTLDVYSQSEADALVEDHLEKPFALQESASLGDLVVARGSNLYVDHTSPNPSILSSGIPAGAGVTLLTNSLMIAMWADGGTLYFKAGSIAADLSLSFGAVQSVAATVDTGYVSVHRLSDTSFVAIWDDAVDVQGVVGTVSETTITLGAATTLSTGDARNNVGVAILSSTKFAVVFSDTAATNFIAAVAATVSGTTITPGATVNNGTAGHAVAACMAATDEVLVVFRVSTTEMRFRRFTLSGTSVTWEGSEYALTVPTGHTEYYHFLYRLDDYHAFCVFGTGEATAERYEFFYFQLRRQMTAADFWITEGNYKLLGEGRATTAGDYRTWWVEFDGKMAALYQADGGNQYVQSHITLFIPSTEGMLIGNKLELGIDLGVSAFSGMCYVVAVRDGIIVISLIDATNQYAAFQALQAPLVLGIAKETGASPATVIRGYSANFSGLVAGQRYYLKPQGGLTTVPVLGGAYVGQAISATEVVR